MKRQNVSERDAGTADPELCLAFVGDICLAAGVLESLKKMRSQPLEQTRALLGQADVVVGNLECALVADGAADASSASVMRVPTSLVDREVLEPFDVMGLANNHTMDGGASGLSDTLEFLERNRFASFGAGADLSSAERHLIVEVKGVRVALLGGCDVARCHADRATPGVAPLSRQRLVERIGEAKASADVVVLLLHADIEFSHHPSPGRVRLSRALIDAGADAVIQHHPHVVQGIESYRNGVIAYSLGNFLFPVAGNRYMQRHRASDWGLILFLRVCAPSQVKSISWSVEPVTIGGDNRPAPSTGERREEQLRVLGQISADLQDDRRIRREWWNRCRLEARSSYYVLAQVRRRSGNLAMLSSLAALLGEPEERRWIFGLLSVGYLG